jgi:hypothetical protein
MHDANLRDDVALHASKLTSECMRTLMGFPMSVDVGDVDGASLTIPEEPTTITVARDGEGLAFTMLAKLTDAEGVEQDVVIKGVDGEESFSFDAIGWSLI